MKAIIFSGCPRKNGNTMQLTNKFIEGLRESGCEVEFVDTNKLNVRPCVSCGNCERTGDCAIKDDMQGIYKKTEESDIIILTSPVYFASVSAQLKILIDRFQVFYNRRFVLKIDKEIKRKGYLIFTGGLKNEKMIDCMSLLAKFFMLSCSAKLMEPIFAIGTDDIKIKDRPELLEKAYSLGLEAGKS